MFVSSEVVVGARLASRAYKAHDSLSSIGNVQYFLRYIYEKQAKKIQHRVKPFPILVSKVRAGLLTSLVVRV